MTPVVSVVMPVYNGARFLREAIDSILAQTCRDFEFIVIDDGSTDESPSIVASYTDPRIRLIRTGAQSGVAAALNAGIRAASSDLIARQDADDVSEATRLERQIAAFRARPQLALLGTQATIVDASGAVRGRTERSLDVAALRWYALLDNPFIHTSVMIRRDVVDACGGYPEGSGRQAGELRLANDVVTDYELWCRVLVTHEAANLPERLVRYRVNAGSVTAVASSAPATSDTARAFAAAMQRIVRHNLEGWLEPARVAEDAGLLARFGRDIRAADASKFCDAFARLLTAYEKRYPGVASTPDFRRTLARQYDAIAYRIAPPDRFVSLAVYARALRRHPALAYDLSWTRALMLVTLGKSGRQAAHARRADGRRTAA